jgi:hypothetical protein
MEKVFKKENNHQVVVPNKEVLLFEVEKSRQVTF